MGETEATRWGKGGCGSWKARAFLEEETGSPVQDLGYNPPLLWFFPSPSADSWQGILSLGFFCVERIPWDTLEAELKDGAGELLEQLQWRLTQHEETLLGCKPTSVITAALLGNKSLFLHCPSRIPSLTCWRHLEKPLCTNLQGRAGAGAAPQLTPFNCSS